MKYIRRLNLKIQTIVCATIITIILLSIMASANMDIQIEDQDNGMKFTVKNVGDNPEYLLNTLIVFDENKNEIYTSQDPVHSDILKIHPGKSYTFEWNNEDTTEGDFTGQIYVGDNEREYKAKKIDFHKKSKPGKPTLFTDGKSFKNGENVQITLKNMGQGNIYVNVNDWEIKDLTTGKVVNKLSKDCTFGYGGCPQSFERIAFKEYLEQTWDQKDSNGNQVAPGKYLVTAQYSTQYPSSGKIHTEIVSSKEFIIKPHKK